MKRLIVQTAAPNKVHVAGSAEDKKSNEHMFSIIDIVDIISQLEEMSDYNIAVRNYEDTLQLGIGDTIYEICDIKDQRYPRRRLRKLEP